MHDFLNRLIFFGLHLIFLIQCVEGGHLTSSNFFSKKFVLI